MTTPQTKSHIEELFRSRGLRPHRRLGQNFLVDPNMMAAVVREADPGPSDVILEIGPGTGSLTALLAEKAHTVVAVEIDEELARICREGPAAADNVRLFHRDILRNKNRMDDEIVEELARLAPPEGELRLKVVSNLPYSAATPVLVCLLTGTLRVETMVVTVQKEIADRLNAAPGSSDYGLLSLVARRFAKVKVLRKMPPEVFWPKPKVASALVRVTPFRAFGEDAFVNAELLKTAKGLFSQRRKNVGNAMTVLDTGLGIGKEGISAVLADAGLERTKRSDELSPDDVEKLTRAILRYKKKG